MQKRGFTIVELLIVIVVIAILAAITIAAYNGVQARARDSIRKQDLAQLAKATKLYAVDNGDYVEAGCGSGGSGSGWLPVDYDTTGPWLSVNGCLMRNGHLNKEIKDPSGLGSCSGITCFAYMKCSGGAGTFYMAHLEALPQTSSDTDATNCTTYDTSYGMNYVLKVN